MSKLFWRKNLITSKQQKNKVLKQIQLFEERLSAPTVEGVPPHMVKVSQQQIKTDIKNLRAEVTEFDEACEADIESLAFNTLEEMLKVPIKVRLSTGLDRSSFARKIGISTSTLKRYEVAEYANAPATVLEAIFKKYHLEISGQTSHAA